MKRSKALRALSHQHHQGLFAALQLKRARRETAFGSRPSVVDVTATGKALNVAAVQGYLGDDRQNSVPAIIRSLRDFTRVLARGGVRVANPPGIDNARPAG